MGEFKISKEPGTLRVKPYTPTSDSDLINIVKSKCGTGVGDAFRDAVDALSDTILVDNYGTLPYYTFEEKGVTKGQMKKEEIRKDTRTTVEDGLKYTSFSIYNDGEPLCSVDVPKVESVQFYNGGKVAKVTFADGHFERAVLKATTPEELEEERKEAAIAICLLKHQVAHGNYTLGYGSNIYNKWMERILKQNKKAEEAKKAEADKERALKERKERIAEKKARKKERRLSRLNEGNKNK